MTISNQRMRDVLGMVRHHPSMFGGRQFEPLMLRFGGTENEGTRLSIQASVQHYCSPRANLPRLTDYQAVEIALIAPNGEWMQPEQHKEDELVLKVLASNKMPGEEEVVPLMEILGLAAKIIYGHVGDKSMAFWVLTEHVAF